MMNRRLAFKIALCASFAGVLALATLAATPSYATSLCPQGQAACVIVNSNQDNDVRDGVVTLREAMLLDTGGLSLAGLTPLEMQQVTGNDFSAEGVRGIYFNPTIFCEGCASNVIYLQLPPGFGGPSAAVDQKGTKQIAMNYVPPGFGGPASLPPGFGGPAVPAPFVESAVAGGGGQGNMSLPGLSDDALMTPPGFGGPGSSIGLAAAGLGEMAARVTLDGSLLGASTVGLRIEHHGGWIRGAHFRNFAGTALQIMDSLQTESLVGTNADGLLDTAETVTFANNGRDIESATDE